MSQNPYQAPQTDSFSAPPTPQPSDVIAGRLQFEGTLTRQHHRDAVIKAGIRRDYQNTTRVMLWLAGAFVVFAWILMLMSVDFVGTNLIRLVIASILFPVGVIVFCLNHRWLVGIQIPSYQLTEGHIKGWIDRQGLWIETPSHASYCPLTQLVSSAATHDIWVLCFSKNVMFWQTIPMAAFADPSVARGVAADLQRIRPPLNVQMDDERKREVPNQPCLFTPATDAVHFAGDFCMDRVRGTRFDRASKRLTRKTWGMLAWLLGSILVSLLALAGFRSLYLGIALLWVLLFAGNLLLRIWRARRRSKRGGRSVAWHAKGWLDDEGYCAMTALGQSRSSWSFFRHFEITDQVIGLYPHASDACCCLIEREQFKDAEDWGRAIELVRQKMHRSDRSVID